MSLFGTKKKIYVASSVNKIVDDGTPQKSFIREVVASTALSSNASLGEALSAALKEGPRGSQRSFFRWAKLNYDIGMPRAAINYTEVIDYEALAAEIHTDVFGSDVNISIQIVEAFIDNADESYYAERWIYENRPELAHLQWAADVDQVTNDIWIQYPSGTMYLGNPISNDSFNVADYNSSDDIIMAYFTYTTISTGIVSPTQAFIYKIGDGVEDLDSYQVALTDGSSTREFYPFIPLRINNKSVFQSGSPALTHKELITKAWKKGLSSDIQDALDEINSNADIGDIDYAYLVFGICLNTKSVYEQEYLFEFFKGIASSQGPESSAYGLFEATNDALGYHKRKLDGQEQLNTAAYNDSVNPGYLQRVDAARVSVGPQITNVHLTLPSSDLGNLDMKITWSDISEERITGELFPGAKPGDVRVSEGPSFVQTTAFGFLNGLLNQTSTVSGLRIGKQISLLEYEVVTVRGLQHKNLIYQGKSVDTTAGDALADAEPSGFVIPLHEPTLKRLGAVRATQIARESYLIVFNSYQVVKKKWYQTGIFKALLAIVLVVVAVVLTVMFGPAGLSAAAATNSGILGMSAVIGTALGFTGLMAIAVGTAVNMIAAMIVLQLISTSSEALFGEKIARIITMVAAVVIAFGSGPGGFSFGNISSNISNMAAIDKLLFLTNSAADVTKIITENQIEKILAASKATLESFNEEMKSIEKLMEQFQVDGLIDPMMFTDFTNPLDAIKAMGEKFVLPSSFGETAEDFLNRTLMTSSDLIDLSNAMVSDFVDATLTLR